MIEKLEPKEWLELNAKLQKKKNALRGELADKGILPKKGKNDYDKYKYFSEAQYKELFTDLFYRHGLELNYEELEYNLFENGGKNSNGRITKLRFYLFDADTGFYETSDVSGEGVDKGDKAGYKGYTGALKYYLANKFMVATGDEVETESPSANMNKKAPDAVRPANQTQIDEAEPLIGEEQLKLLRGYADEVGISAETICNTYNVKSLPELTMTQYRHATMLLQQEEDKKKGAKNE